MIKMDYKFSEEWDAKTEQSVLSTVDDAAIRYDLFLGDIILRIGQHDFSANWGWIPIVDFVLSLASIAETLVNKNGEAEFEFTESNAKLWFKREDDNVIISCSYAPGAARVSLSDFSDAIKKLVRHVLTDLTNRYPNLSKNETFQELFNKC